MNIRVSNRKYNPTTIHQLFNQSRRYIRGSGRNNNPIEGSKLFPSQRAVTGFDDNVAVSQSIENLSSNFGDFSLKLGETVTDDDDRDILTGSSGLDWFFFDEDRDRATDLHDEVYANDLAWILAE